MDIQWPVVGSWALAACGGVALLAWYAVRSANHTDADCASRLEKRRQYLATKSEWKDAIRSGNLFMAAEIKRVLDSMREQGWHKLILLLLISLMAGCTTNAVVPPVLIPTGDHIILPQPGDIVPQLPAGESCWWLTTPTGLSFLLPVDAPILNSSTNAP